MELTEKAEGWLKHMCVFQTKLDSDSTAKWTLIPAQSGH